MPLHVILFPQCLGRFTVFPSSWWEDNLFFVLLWVLHFFFNYFRYYIFFPPGFKSFFHRHMLINTLFNTKDELLHCPLSLSPFCFCEDVCVCVCVCVGVHCILQTQLSTLLAFLKIHFSLLNSGRLPPSDWVLSHPAAWKLSLIVIDNNHRVQLVYSPIITIDSVQFSCSVMSNSLQTHELSHARPPCPSPIPQIYPNSCPLSWWCHPTISNSIIPFCPALNLSQNQGLFKWDSSSHQVAKVLEFQLQQLVQLHWKRKTSIHLSQYKNN